MKRTVIALAAFAVIATSGVSEEFRSDHVGPVPAPGFENDPQEIAYARMTEYLKKETRKKPKLIKTIELFHRLDADHSLASDPEWTGQLIALHDDLNFVDWIRNRCERRQREAGVSWAAFQECYSVRPGTLMILSGRLRITGKMEPKITASFRRAKMLK